MARIIFIPDDTSVLQLDTPLSARELLRAIRSGEWQLPSPYPPLDPSYRIIIIGSVVVISPSLPVEPPVEKPSEGILVDLSPRMRQILKGIADGLSDKEIAERIHVSPHTVTKYVSSLKNRLGARNRAALLTHALSMGLIRMKHRNKKE